VSELERYVVRSLTRAKRKHFLIDKLAAKAPGSRDELEASIDSLVRAGTVLRTRKGRIALTDRIGVITGTVQVGRRGRAVVIPDEPDAPISIGRGVRPAMHGDRVLVDVDPYRRRGLYSGKIREVLERRCETLVGRVVSRGDGAPVLVPTDSRSGYVATLTADSPVPEPDRIVAAHIVEYPTSYRDPVVRVEHDLGRAGTLEAEIESVCRSRGIAVGFSPSVEQECEKMLPPEHTDTSGRTDLTDTLTFTIDPEDARDHDDAVSITATERGWRAIISIADVSHYVRPGTATDLEAYDRATSVYFPGRCVPMLPERISSELASLVPGQDRLAVSAFLDIARDGSVIDCSFARTVIRSAHRLTYEQAQSTLDGESNELSEDTREALACLSQCARALTRRRLARGSIDLDLPEPRIELDADGEPARIVRRSRLDTHRIIEELMIATNEAVARFLEAHDSAFLYRIHERPDEESVVSLATRLSLLGHRLERDGAKLTPRVLADVVESARGSTEERVVNMMVLRSMKQARYSPAREIHFGLASSAYAHFTSPIRRYPDLVVHRALCAVIDASETHTRPPGTGALVPVGDHCSERERRAMDAERDIDRAASILLMQGRIGETLDGEVTAVERYGFRVELASIFVEGFVPVSRLDEYYDFVSERMELQSRTSSDAIRIGDRIRVRVDAADLPERRLEFSRVRDT
jgi:ribonuclease R